MLLNKFTLEREDTLLLIIDIQEKLVPVIANKEEVVKNTGVLIETAKEMNIPIIVTEQYPKGIGPTVSELEESLPVVEKFEKLNFSACTNKIMDAIKKTNKKKIIIVGIETHVCVIQTARDLLGDKYQVFVPIDGVGSRTKENKQNGLDLMKDMGAVITNTETIIFDLMKKSGTPEFKLLSKLIK